MSVELCKGCESLTADGDCLFSPSPMRESGFMSIGRARSEFVGDQGGCGLLGRFYKPVDAPVLARLCCNCAYGQGPRVGGKRGCDAPARTFAAAAEESTVGTCGPSLLDFQPNGGIV